MQAPSIPIPKLKPSSRLARTCSGHPWRDRSASEWRSDLPPNRLAWPSHSATFHTVHRDGIIAVYIMASRKNGTLYTGMTSDLARRAFEHREGALGGFTKRYGVRRVVWYESFELITAAMQRERTSRATLDSGRST